MVPLKRSSDIISSSSPAGANKKIIAPTDWFLYIIRAAGGSLYTGITTDVDRRVREHGGSGSKGAKYFRGKKPVKLVFFRKVGCRSSALKLECAVKKMTKQQKETLVKRKRLRTPTGFTLLEILISISLISVLAALLLPALRNAREKGKEVTCLNNLKQIGVAVELYTQDWNGWLPAVWNSTEDWAKIYVTLNGYCRNSNIFWCPSSGESRRWDGVDGPTDMEGVSYGFNFAGTGNTVFPKESGALSKTDMWPASYRKVSELVAPTLLIVAMDSYEDMWQEFNVQYLPFNWTYGPSDIHHGGSNVLFADGHVSWQSINYLRNTISIWNYDNSNTDY